MKQINPLLMIAIVLSWAIESQTGQLLAQPPKTMTEATLDAASQTRPSPAPIIHVSDLFRPHDDPDDHWDLLVAYSLAARGQLDLRGILIDYPKQERHNAPDVLAVAQLNYLTGKAVPVAVGAPRLVAPGQFDNPAAADALNGPRTLLRWLRESPGPTAIHVLGSCRDVALASQLDPELFRRKCRAIYLNAGSGSPDAEIAKKLEWNVRIDREAYVAIFQIPCPIYWMPCFENATPVRELRCVVARYGTFFKVHQGDVMAVLSPRVRNYFAYMYQHGRFVTDKVKDTSRSADWLHALNAAPLPALVQEMNAMDRHMWCLGGFLDSAGLTVTKDGELVSVSEAVDAVYGFVPVEIECGHNAITRWKLGPPSVRNRMFQVRDTERYQSAMTSALRDVVREL